MSSSQSRSSTSAEHIERMQMLYGEIRQIEKESRPSDDNILRIKEIVLESSKYEEKSATPIEKIIDAKILHSGTNCINSNVKAFNTNLASFNESTYVNGVLSFVENSNLGIGWNSFAPVTYHLFRKSHPLTYMLGTFTLEPPPVKQKVKVERQRKVVEAQKKVVASITEKETPDEEEKSVYDHILTCLKTAFKNNGKKPVKYFNFIIDPDSYWRTVENIFHFAFLVHDGYVKMLIKNNLPFVVPVYKKTTTNDAERKEENYHFCFSLSVQQWKECIKKFDIASASIPPFVHDK